MKTPSIALLSRSLGSLLTASHVPWRFPFARLLPVGEFASWLRRRAGVGVGLALLCQPWTAFAITEVLPLYNFGSAGPLTGNEPAGRLLLGSDDDLLYGTTRSEGEFGGGTVFRVAKDGSGYLVLHAFGGDPGDGVKPQAGLLEGSDGFLYGTTYLGGTRNAGTLFRVSKDGSVYEKIREFASDADGGYPQGRLVEDTDGMLYGCTESGGSGYGGTVYKVRKNGTDFATVYRFTTEAGSGRNPQAHVLLGSDNLLYGTTQNGSSGTEAGTVFRVDKNGLDFQVLHRFTRSPDGATPQAGLIEGAGGFLYGTTRYGGASDGGTVYRLKTNGDDYSVLHSFVPWSNGGSESAAELTQGTDGFLYGTTASFFGGVFRLNADGSGYTVLRYFQSSDDPGSLNATVVQDSTGQLFGAATLGRGPRGSLFRLNADGTGLTIIKAFTLGSGDGAAPYADPLVEADGSVYGVAAGGDHNGGVIYRLNLAGTGFAILHHFGDRPNDGTGPAGTLVKASDGALYGVTGSGAGSAYFGTLFRIQTTGTGYATVFTFPGPIAGPNGRLVEKDGVLYGTAGQGGPWVYGGVAFKINLDGTGFTVLHEFGNPNGDGSQVADGLREGSDGMLYGVTLAGGAYGSGTLYRLSKDGVTYEVLHSFDGANDGSLPLNVPSEAPDGRLYGAAWVGGGNSSRGTVFRISKNGADFEVLHRFVDRDDAGSPRSGLVPWEGDFMLGTAGTSGQSCGAIFRINRDGSGYRLLATDPFPCSNRDVDSTLSGLVKGPDGAFYGVRAGGGPHNLGYVFRLTVSNSAPTATALAAGAERGVPVPLALSGSDPDQDPLVYRVVDAPAHGTLTGTAPQVTYTSAANYTGPDSFTFVVNDGILDSPPATVNLTVTHLNRPPVAQSLSVTTAEDTGAAVNLAASDLDGDPLSFVVVDAPSHGTLSGTPPNLTYTPATGYRGSDSFTFKANDGAADSAPATVSILVTRVNHPPLAPNLAVTVTEDTRIIITLPASDPDGDPLSSWISANYSNGWITSPTPQGEVGYQPYPNYVGPASFDYTVSDNYGATATGTVTITITPVEDPPQATAQSVTTLANTPLAITLSATDPDNDPLTYAVTTPPAHGVLTGTPPDLTYAPEATFLGLDSFTFTVDDGQGGTASATVTIDVALTPSWASRINTGTSGLNPVGIGSDRFGNTYTVGNDASVGSVFLTKFDAAGQQVWSSAYSDGNQPNAVGLAVDPDGNAHVVGVNYTYDPDLGYSRALLLVMKYDNQGNQVWLRQGNPVEVTSEYGNAIRVDASGNVVVIADVYDNAPSPAVIKFDSAGNEVWTRRLGENGTLRALALDTSGNIYAAGSSYDRGATFLAAKYSTDGQQQWLAAYNRPGDYEVKASAVAVDAAGNVVLTGGALDWSTDADIVTLKYDADGNELWAARYDNPTSGSDVSRSVAVDSGGNVTVLGTAYDWPLYLWGYFWSLGELEQDMVGWNAQAALIRYDANGQLLSSALGFGSASDMTYGRGLGIDAAGRTYVSATAYNPGNGWSVLTAAFAQDGSTLWHGRYHSATYGSMVATAQSLDAAGTVSVLAQGYDESGSAPLVIRYGTAVTLDSITPSSAAAYGASFTITVHGSGFDASATVYWNGQPRSTTLASSSQINAQIPDTDLQVAGELTTAQVTVRDARGNETGPLIFTILGANVGAATSAIVAPGQTATVDAVPSVEGAAGIAAAVSNAGDAAPVTATVATYLANPTGEPVFDAGGGFVDLKITGADLADAATAWFFYPSTVTGATEDALRLLYFDGSAWALAKSSGDSEPVKDTTDNLDGTVSGGRFAVTFDGSSTPKITELGGTVFAATVVQPPTIAVQPQGLTVTAGEAAAFTVVAEGQAPLHYQWLRNSAELPGRTSATLNLVDVSVADAADYSVRVSNVGGEVLSQPAPLVVTRRTPSIVWANPADIVYGTPLGAAQLNASSDVPGTFSYSPAPGTVLSPGNARGLTVTFTPTDAGRYGPASANVVINVTRATLTVRAADLDKVYGAPVPTLTASYSGFVNGDTVASLSSVPVPASAVTSASPVGSYPVTLSGGAAQNYDLVLVPGTFTVTKAPLTITADNKSKAYGAALPALTLTYAGFVNGDTAARLSTPPVLSTTALRSSSVGEYTIAVSGATAANYAITMVPGTLTITPVPLTITAVNKTKVYGNAIPALTATYAGFVNGDTASSLDTPVTLGTSATATSPVGNYSITASGAADLNYVISYAAGTLAVTARSLTITAQNKTMAYGAALPVLTAAYSGLAPGETAADIDVAPTLTTTAVSGSNVGAYPVTVSGAADPNYTITMVNGTLTINQAALTIRAVAKSKTYGAAVPALTYTLTGLVNGDTEASLDTPVTISTVGAVNSPVGTYPIVVGGASDANYKVTFANANLTVTKAPLTIKAQNATKVYGAALPALPVTYTGFVLGENESVLTTPAAVTTTATPSSNAGSYPITVSGATAANYSLTFSGGTLTVSKAPLTITADNKTKKQGTANPVLTASYAGFVNGDTVASLDTAVALSTTATTTSPVGSYPITPKNAKDINYTITFVNGTLSVTP